MIQDVQAYEKPTECQECNDDQNDRHDMLGTRCCVVIIIISAQGDLLSSDDG